MPIESTLMAPKAMCLAELPAWDPMIAKFGVPLNAKQKNQFSQGVWNMVSLQINRSLKRQKEAIRRMREDEQRNR